MPMISVIASSETVSIVKFASSHRCERDEQRRRYGEHDDDGVAPRVQEEEHHDSGEGDCFDQRTDDAGELLLVQVA